MVADGVFDSQRGREFMGSSEGLMDTEEMAEAYWKLHTQGKRAWTWEIDLRPYLVCPGGSCTPSHLASSFKSCFYFVSSVIWCILIW